MNKEKINLVWLKRDLRLHDNEAISSAIKSGKRFLIFYAFEKILLNDLHYNVRHWDFIKQSIVDINKELIGYESKILSVSSDIIGLCNQIQNFYVIDTVYSHIETGILTTYIRDKEFKRYCRNNNISWKENINNGVQRGLQHREKWYEEWEYYMKKKQEVFNPLEDQILKLEEIKEIEKVSHPISLKTPSDTKFQKGGRSMGIKYLSTFLMKDIKNICFTFQSQNYQEQVAAGYHPI